MHLYLNGGDHLPQVQIPQPVNHKQLYIVERISTLPDRKHWLGSMCEIDTNRRLTISLISKIFQVFFITAK